MDIIFTWFTDEVWGLWVQGGSLMLMLLAIALILYYATLETYMFLKSRTSFKNTNKNTLIQWISNPDKADHETQLASAKSSLHHSTKQKEANYQRRQQWIENAAANAHRQITESVEGQKGSRISQVQAQTLKAKRQFESDLARCRKSIASLEDKLLECKQLYRKLHSLALACFRGFPILYLKVKNSAKKKHAADLTNALTAEEFATSIEYEAPFKFEKLLSILKEQLSDFS